MGKRILILTADAGFGHRSAANAIAEALEPYKEQGYTVEIANPLDDPKTPGFLRRQQADYDKIVNEIPDYLVRFGYESSSAPFPAAVIDNALALLLYETMRKTLDHYRPDVILSTYTLYQAPLWAVFTVQRQAVPLITVVTDLVTVHQVWFHPASDYVLAPTEQVHELALAAGLAPDQVKVTGLPVSPRIGELRKHKAGLREQLGWLPDRPAALVAGSKRVRKLADILRAVNHSMFPLQLALVAGGDEGLLHSFQETEWHLPVHIYGFVNTMPELMGASDLIIGKAGGLITTEALASGLPLLLVDVLPGQEDGNAAFVVEGGAGDRAESPLAALETLFHWLDKNGALLKERAANARKLGKPDAARDAAILAVQLAAQGPVARTRRGLLSRARLLGMLREGGVKAE